MPDLRLWRETCKLSISHMLRKQFLETSRGRIAELLQRGTQTVDALATALKLTPNAVRAQLTVMERDGLVRRAGLLSGATRPSHIYELTPALEELLSGAYVPLLIHLVRTFSSGLRPAQLEPLLRADRPEPGARVRGGHAAAGRSAGACPQGERVSQQRARRRDPCRAAKRRLRPAGPGLSPRGHHRQGARGLHGDRKPAAGTGRRAGAAVLRSGRPSASAASRVHSGPRLAR